MATGIPPKSRQILKNLQPKLIKPIWCSFPPSATFIVRWLWCGYHVLVKMTGYNCHSVGQNPLLRMSMTRNAARNVPHPKAGHRMFQVPAWMGGPCSVACAETPAGHFAITKRKVVGVATFYHQLVGVSWLVLWNKLCKHVVAEGCCSPPVTWGLLDFMSAGQPSSSSSVLLPLPDLNCKL